MSEELLLNDRRGNLIHQGSILYGCKKFDPTGIEPLTSQSIATLTNHCATSQLILLRRNRFYISNFGALEITQNDERKREKVTWEVKKCSRRKTQNCQAKDLHKQRHTRLQ